MATERRVSFIDLLRSSGLLEAAQIRAIQTAPEFRGIPFKSAAKLILERGWLTEFQLKLILLGRGAELTLGPYRLLARLGEGGMGQVFKAHHRPMNRIVALKLIKKERLAKPSAVQRFYREVRAAAQLSHPNIVVAFDAGEVNGTHFFAMEYVQGIDLARLVEQSGPLSVLQACEYIRQAALGLQHAFERGLVHRDIKPSNLLLARAENSHSQVASTPVVKILDMGLARWDSSTEEDQGLTREGQLVGTPDFLAPEQARNARGADVRSDLYSMGCTFHFLLSGEVPFRSDSLTESLLKHQMQEPPALANFRNDVPSGVAQIIRKLMAKKPEERFSTPLELAAALEPYCRGQAPLTSQQSSAERDLPGEFDWDLLTQSPNALPLRETVLAEGSPTAASSAPQPEPTPPAAPRGRDNRSPWVRLAFVAAAIAGLGLIASQVPDWIHRTSKEGAHSPTTSVELSPKVGTGPGANENLKPATSPTKVVEGGGSNPPAVPAKVEPTPAPFAGHARTIRSLSVSPRGVVLSAGDDGTARIWDVLTGKELQRFSGHTGPVWSAVFSRDGKWVYTAGEDKTVRMWDVDTGQERRQFRGHQAPVRALAVSPDDTRLVSGGGELRVTAGTAEPVDCLVRVWEVTTALELHKLRGHNHSIHAIALSPDGARILSAGNDQIPILWELSTGKQLGSFTGSTAAIRGVAFTQGGGRIVAAGLDGKIHEWDPVTGQHAVRIAGNGRAILALAASPDGSRLLAGTGPVEMADDTAAATPSMLRHWDAATGRDLGQFAGHPDLIHAVAFLPGGQQAFSAGKDRILRKWDLTRPTIPPEPERVVSPPIARGRFEGHLGRLTAVAFSIDGQQVYTGGQDKTVRIWNLSAGTESNKLSGHRGEIRCLAVSPNGKFILSGDSEGAVQVWNAETGQPGRSLTGPVGVQAAVFFADSRRAALAFSNGLVLVWQAGEGANAGGVTQTFGSTGAAATAVAVSSDKKLLAFGLADGTIKLVDVDAGKEAGPFATAHKGAVHGLAFSADNRQLLSAGADETLRIWNLRDGKESRRLAGAKGSLQSLALSPDGRYVLAGGSDKIIRMWDLKAPAAPPKQLGTHAQGIQDVRFSPDGSWAASVAEGLKLWELRKAPPAKLTTGNAAPNRDSPLAKPNGATP